MVRLIVTGTGVQTDPYAAFSHCWGKTKALKLLQGNMAKLPAGIDTEELPASYKEAIFVCRGLGLSHLWIDSLCIIQDSVDDWHREAAVMKDVYENSSLQICAAAAANNSEQSFSSRDTSLILPLEVHTQWEGEDAVSYYLSDSEMYQKDISNSPLRTRAWVLQEAWLSRRSLSLSRSQIWWECRQKVACETYPGGVPLGELEFDLADSMREHSLRLDASPASRPDLDANATYRRWIGLVENYSNCGLTVLSDKLIAFSGIAQSFKESHNAVALDQYAAGFWRSQLPAALYWSTTQFQWTFRPAVYRAPSWSWASLEGGVAFPAFETDVEQATFVKTLCELLGIQLHLMDQTHVTGLLKGGALDLRGRLILVRPTRDGLECLSSPDPALSDAVAEAGWGFDETKEDGTDALSYLDLDQLDPYLCEKGQVDIAIRKTTSWADVGGELFCLPVLERISKDGTFIFGLLIYQPPGQASKVYQRVGTFNHLPLEGNTLMKLPSQEITLV